MEKSADLPKKSKPLMSNRGGDTWNLTDELDYVKHLGLSVWSKIIKLRNIEPRDFRKSMLRKYINASHLREQTPIVTTCRTYAKKLLYDLERSDKK